MYRKRKGRTVAVAAAAPAPRSAARPVNTLSWHTRFTTSGSIPRALMGVTATDLLCVRLASHPIFPYLRLVSVVCIVVVVAVVGSVPRTRVTTPGVP